MSVFEILGAVLIGPLKLLFEVIFSVAYRVIQHPGPAIIVLSLIMNILVLPLYRRADAIQIQARDKENKLKDVIAHIKKTFSGDERMMILQTYYRQNNYSPLSVLSGSVSLLLEIPFFMAAYQFLSGVSAFQEVSFGPIADLSAPDGLLVIGSVSINLLPIIMTLVNVVSSSLYLKGFPLKTKIQLYGMALFFLVFLYNSPAALVFYWTLNNLFSLVKTLFYRIKHSRVILNVLLCICGIASVFLGLSMEGFWRSSFMLCAGIAAQLPWFIPFAKKHFPCFSAKRQPGKPNTSLFVLGAVFLTVLVGLQIPSTYVAASPQEYIDLFYFYNPVWYVVHTLCLSSGTFLVWMRVFYWLANDAGKVFFSRLVWIMSGIMVVNYMFFGTKLGIVSPDLIYGEGFGFSLREHVINIAVILVLIVGLYLLVKKAPKGVSTALLVGSIALTCMSVVNVVKIAGSAAETKKQTSNTYYQLPSFSMSQEGKNVVMIMLDRGIGPFIPYLLEENPSLEAQFDGFTYYANTLAYGASTNFGAPALYGGFEYTPVNMNLRGSELLVDKHNESLKVLPTLFAEEGYDVTLIDPSYANYKWIPDLSVFSGMEGVQAYLADGQFSDRETRAKTINTRNRNFFFFSLMKTLPVSLQAPLYDGGTYRALPAEGSDTSGVWPAFMNAYEVLDNMQGMTNITAKDENTFMFIRSNFTHEAVILQEPDFKPLSVVDNSPYYPQEGKTITDGETSILLQTENAIAHYHVNMGALMKLGAWFDYLRENDVYDNTRIIIVSDHGRNLDVFGSDPSNPAQNIEAYLPMLLIKDFGAEGFTTSDAFMTTADAPVLALDGLIDSPVNPFTGNKISSDYKVENDQFYVILSDLWDVNENDGYLFLPSPWASVSGDVTNKENWIYYSEPSYFPPN